MTTVKGRFYDGKTLQIVLPVNVCDTIHLLARFPQCNGGKIEDAEDFKSFLSFIVC